MSSKNKDDIVGEFYIAFGLKTAFFVADQGTIKPDVTFKALINL